MFVCRLTRFMQVQFADPETAAYTNCLAGLYSCVYDLHVYACDNTCVQAQKVPCSCKTSRSSLLLLRLQPPPTHCLLEPSRCQTGIPLWLLPLGLPLCLQCNPQVIIGYGTARQLLLKLLMQLLLQLHHRPPPANPLPHPFLPLGMPVNSLSTRRAARKSRPHWLHHPYLELSLLLPRHMAALVLHLLLTRVAWWRWLALQSDLLSLPFVLSPAWLLQNSLVSEIALTVQSAYQAGLILHMHIIIQYMCKIHGK